jgi:hypothetical protein
MISKKALQGPLLLVSLLASIKHKLPGVHLQIAQLKKVVVKKGPENAFYTIY